MGPSLSPVTAALLASLAAGLATGLGATPVLIRDTWNRKSQRFLLAVSGGVMLSAAFFSLLLPGLDHARAIEGTEREAVLTVSGGVVLGALALWLLHALVPHEHFEKGREGVDVFRLGRHWLFVLAIAIHNLPEGLSVGVAFGSGSSTGASVTIGMALQNFPEGLAVAAALVHDRIPRRRAFATALLTGLVEPVGALIGAATVGLSAALLPWGLAFAAGAMLFVVSGEVIPETHREGSERLATFAAVLGFVGMMAVARLLV